MMSPYRAVKELARWSDDKKLDALVIGALRERASRLSGEFSRAAYVSRTLGPASIPALNR
jgi:hypothetical protein